MVRGTSKAQLLCGVLRLCYNLWADGGGKGGTADCERREDVVRCFRQNCGCVCCECLRALSGLFS